MLRKIIISPEAEEQLSNIAAYLRYRLDSYQAMDNVLNDFEQTVKRLAYLADGLVEKQTRSAKTFRTLRFKKHRYIVVYNIDNDTIRIIGIYHASQNYEKYLR